MIAEVIVDIQNSQVDRVFDYFAPDDIDVGCRVLVPFGKRTIEGYIINKKYETEVCIDKLKGIIRCEDAFSAIIPEMLELMKHMVKKYHVRMIDALRLFIPSHMRQSRVKELVKTFYRLDLDAAKNAKLSDKQQNIVDYLKGKDGEFSAVLNSKFSPSSIKTLCKNQILIKEDVYVARKPYADIEETGQEKDLNDDQKQAVETITQSEKSSFLLHGVTGSGKTEVYMNCITHYRQQGKNAIMLVPEISLTPQMLSLFRGRFGSDVAILHSGLSAGERYDEWRRLRMGEAHIAIGARSAIFAPLDNLGIIIIDEEHDASYISETNPRYNTHEIAAFRQQYNNCNLVLGSATPSVESYLKSEIGMLQLIKMSKRVNTRPLPPVEIVDMRDEIRSGNNSGLSFRLIEELKNCISENNQAIIFINRRGYSSFVMCHKCGYVAKCDDCDISLTYHSEECILKCHYCNSSYYFPNKCPDCESVVRAMGSMGTQKAVDELQKLFPDVAIVRLDNDSTQGKESHKKILHDYSTGKAQILVGTQMVAKGHDFPNVTLVGILDADQSLHFSDYRAAERTFQLITQVSGRCGRDERSGKVILQSFMPRHQVLRLAASQDYVGFYKREINLREVTHFPPYAKIVRVLVTGTEDGAVGQITQDIFLQVRETQKRFDKNFLFLTKSAAPVKRIQKKYRNQILMRLVGKRADVDNIIECLYNIVSTNKNDGVSVFVEINPLNLS